jgi:serine/threonine-protein kinase
MSANSGAKSSSADDPRVADLLLQWEELDERGESVSAVELCAGCPELANELGRRIAALRRMAPLLKQTGRAHESASISPVASATIRARVTARADFQNLRFYAAGALGEIYVARNAELNRDVALKFLRAGRSHEPASLRRFLKEAQITGSLEHPGVVPIYALGTDDSGDLCYAMRFIRGQTLQDAIEAFHAVRQPLMERAPALRELLNRFVSVCNTIAFAHSRGILHCDLKPRNVMLGDFDETLVLDWGLAKGILLEDSSGPPIEEMAALMSDSGRNVDPENPRVLGTPAYMSPEQALDRSAVTSPASDIFSLGAILYTIVTGQAPYDGRSFDEVMRNVKRCEFRPPRQMDPAIPRPLEEICLKAMARDPKRRYATALELAADIRHWLADEPVLAFDEPVTTRLRRWRRRHRTLVTSAGAVLVFGLAALAGFAMVLAAKNRELDSKNIDLAHRNRELDVKNQELARHNQELEAQRRRATDAVKQIRRTTEGDPSNDNEIRLQPLRAPQP